MPLILLCGPTGVGKSSLALQLARQCNGEILSADSGQVYRQCDIGTAKPTPEERREIPHHFIDVLDPGEPCSAGFFALNGREAISEIAARGRPVFVVGGTGLYIRALLEGLSPIPAGDPKIRRELEQQGMAARHKTLSRVDPEAAKKIPAENRQRVIRALEVWRLTGRPISELQREKSPPLPDPLLKIGLMEDRPRLYQKIDDRVLRMMQQGWIEETRELIHRWGREIPPLKLIGYREIGEYLNGKRSSAETVRLIQQKSRNYAKRQTTWFRKDPEIRWFDPSRTKEIQGVVSSWIGND